MFEEHTPFSFKRDDLACLISKLFLGKLKCSDSAARPTTRRKEERYSAYSKTTGKIGMDRSLEGGKSSQRVTRETLLQKLLQVLVVSIGNALVGGRQLRLIFEENNEIIYVMQV